MALPDIPPIRTARLCLRPLQSADLADLHAVNGDDEVTRFLPYTSWCTPEDATTWLARMHALHDAGTGRQLVMQRAGDGRVIGTLLLFRFDEGSARLELGYVVGRAHWRQGYGAEAVRGALGAAFGTLGVRRIEAEVHPDNTGSHALLRAVGFVHEGCLRQRWVAKGRAYDTHVYGCLADEWRARTAAV
jgi:[ribosomal protein S5]-alanine N-acetyltransferase